MDVRTYFFDLADGGADFVLASSPGGDLDSDEGLATAVLISLFTDRFADASDALPHKQSDRRGWWADAFSGSDSTGLQGDLIGSKLWLLPGKQLQENLERAREYAEDALFWLLEDGVAQRVEVLTSNPRDGLLRLDVSVVRPVGEGLALRFESLWGGV